MTKSSDESSFYGLDAGVLVKGAGSATLRGGSVSTTDRGGGTVTAVGGRMRTSGQDAPGIYSTGRITVTGATIVATGAEGAVVEGSNSVTVKDVSMTGGKNGVMLYQSMSGDAQVGTASYVMTGGSLTARGGDAFYVKNTKATVVVKGGATITASSGKLIDAVSKGYITGNGHTVYYDKSASANAALGGKTYTLTGGGHLIPR